MMSNVEFIVVKVIRDNKDKTPTVRNESIRKDNIESFREWFNKGGNGIEGPMVQLVLKSPLVDEKDNTKKIYKLLLNEDYDALNAKIGAIEISK